MSTLIGGVIPFDAFAPFTVLGTEAFFCFAGNFEDPGGTIEAAEPVETEGG
jgi:hypothetical protein